MSAPRIALIHATPAAVQPIQDAFAKLWPEAKLANLLEDSLSRDLAEKGSLDDSFDDRFRKLVSYSLQTGADGILFTCSAFGTCIEKARADVRQPILKPNEAMIEDALAQAKHIGLIATFKASIPSMKEEFEAAAKEKSIELKLETAVAEGAMQELLAGNPDKHDAMIVEAAKTLPPVDLIAFAQFSMTGAAEKVSAATGRKVLTTPDSAVTRLKKALG